MNTTGLQCRPIRRVIQHNNARLQLVRGVDCSRSHIFPATAFFTADFKYGDIIQVSLMPIYEDNGIRSHFLRSVILVSEKAAKIARAIRQEEHLLSLLVREKKEDEKNQRFAHDFKTLADVLVQEVVKHDLGSEFPDLVGHICGEESNEFSCLDGETICLTVGGTEEETYNQLVRILGNERAACTLAHLVHSTAEVDLVIPSCSLSTDELAIWIDPIDATAEYITGGSVEGEVAGMFRTGLPCVTVLIGAFHRLSGTPVLGVINQPFCQQFSDSSASSSKRCVASHFFIVGSHLVQDPGCMVDEETTPTGMIRELHVCDLPCEVERYRESTEFSSSTFPYACFGSLF
ncbi:Formin-like protein 2 [Homalodisca vitripennis]|nr:Formin-like protein 2 [Homalodisca vitripennis]